jgi:ATP-dependent helicase/nuclease subunit A
MAGARGSKSTMSTTTYTPEQAKAIGERKVSVALSAGAGCGKTFVLTERFLSHLEPQLEEAPAPADLAELVAITFTERAAREMRDRIRQKCYERLTAAKGEAATYWLQLLRAIDRARVSTIHGFCATLLRSHAVEAQIDPQFAILEQSHAATLAAEVIDDLLRDRLSAKDELTIGLVTDFGLDRLRDCLHHILHQRSDLDRELKRWLNTSAEEQVAVWVTFYQETILPLLLAEVSNDPAAHTVLSILRDVEVSHETMIERRQTILNLLPHLTESLQPDVDLAALRDATLLTNCGGKKAWPDPDLHATYSSTAQELRAVIDKVNKELEFDAAAALPAAETGLRLLNLGAAVLADYENGKRELGQLDFSDLLSRAHRLLTDPANSVLRKRIAKQIRLLLVDEFQDTDPQQVELVKALCGDVSSGRLFFVGDFKQSIYRFRGADPQVFRTLQDETPRSGRLPLTQNFRSQPAILDFVNAVFCQPFGESYEALRPARKQVSPRPAVEFMWVPVEAGKREQGATDRLRREEADWIARRIRSMIDDGEPIVYDAAAAKNGNPAARAPKLGDFAILFRALTSVAHYEEALRAYGLDYYLVGGHAFYAQQEIFDLVNLLRSLASPADEISLLGVLRSPFFALDDETIFWISRHRHGLSAGLFAQQLPGELSLAQRQHVRSVATLLSDLRRLKDRLPIADLILTALARTGYDAVLLTEFLGERKLANLRKLIDEARSFDRAGVFTLSDFIVQLSQFVAQQPREPLASTHSESTDVVRLMSIHQSKGLEFPIVFVPDIDRMTHGSGGGIELSAQLGPLVRVDSDAPRSGYDLQQVVNRREERGELTRLLYVACTRAADYLVLSGAPEKFEDIKKPWLKLLADRFDLETGIVRGELPAGYEVPQVRITRVAPATKRTRTGRPRGIQWERELEKVNQLCAASPKAESGVLPVPPDLSARRQYSFSSLTGILERMTEASDSLLPPELDPYADAVETAPLAQHRASTASESREGIDPLRLGTLVHAALAQAPGAKGSQQKLDVGLLVGRAASRLLAVEPREIILAEELVTGFLQSPRGTAMSQAKQVHHELEFLLAWPPGSPRTNGIYLQGFLDSLYQDAQGDWHILDYKTNQADASNLAAVASQYEMQLYVYALAAEQVLREPPRELTLYFLRPELEVSYAWNDAARSKVIEWVNKSLRSI